MAGGTKGAIGVNESHEDYVRRLRDNIYGPNPKHCTDEGWHYTKHNWMKPENIAWLEQQPQNQHEKRPLA